MKKFNLLLLLMSIIFILCSCQNNYSSSIKCNMINEYYKDTYNINNPNINSLTYEELIYILESDGNHLILFSEKINKNIKTFYHFSFKENGIDINSDSSINTLSKELINRYFSNLSSFTDKDNLNDTLILYNKTQKIIKLVELNKNIDTFLKEIKTYQLSNYNDEYFFKTAYKTFNDEKINLKNINYNQLIWLLNQEGNFIICFAGAWCKNCQAVIKILNEYATKNNLTIYIFDTKLDGNYAKSHWDYQLNFSITSTSSNTYTNNLNKLYIDLITKYLSNIKTEYQTKFVTYIDDENNKITAKLLQVPYLFLYNKDSKIISHVEQMYTLDETKENYIYKEDNYLKYTTSILELLNEYAKLENIKISDIK